VRLIQYYECEICGRRHNDEAGALACEARGRPECPPAGTIYSFAMHGVRQHMAVSPYMVMLNVDLRGHLLMEAAWACRPDHGDTVGEEHCGGMSAHFYPGNAAVTDDETFHRLVKYLRSEGIEPKVWNGQEVVPWEGP
jgi:hypothetical protein